MAAALEQARLAAALGEVPVGAVITDATGAILARAHNRTRTGHDPTAHAEILAIREACARLQSQRLIGCSLFVTLEPCAMCAATIIEARLQRLIYAASDPKGGAVEHGARLFRHSLHKPEVISGIAEAPAAALLQQFFQQRR